MIRFAIKAGIAGSAVYYLNQEGIWKHSSESLKACEKYSQLLEPYTAEVKKRIPFELPQLPDKQHRSYTINEYWNKGVIATFTFLSEVPCKLKEVTSSGLNAVLENPEIKKLVDSSPQQQPSK